MPTPKSESDKRIYLMGVVHGTQSPTSREQFGPISGVFVLDAADAAGLLSTATTVARGSDSGAQREMGAPFGAFRLVGARLHAADLLRDHALPATRFIMRPDPRNEEAEQTAICTQDTSLTHQEGRTPISGRLQYNFAVPVQRLQVYAGVAGGYDIHDLSAIDARLAELLREHQALRLTDFIQSHGPCHIDALGRRLNHGGGTDGVFRSIVVTWNTREGAFALGERSAAISHAIAARENALPDASVCRQWHDRLVAQRIAQCVADGLPSMDVPAEDAGLGL